MAAHVVALIVVGVASGFALAMALLPEIADYFDKRQ
jgi:hypothetical protein